MNAVVIAMIAIATCLTEPDSGRFEANPGPTAIAAGATLRSERADAPERALTSAANAAARTRLGQFVFVTPPAGLELLVLVGGVVIISMARGDRRIVDRAVMRGPPGR